MVTLAAPLAIDLRGVHKHFGAVETVRGIDLAIGPGEVVAFLGPNGAGKTSTIDMILGLSRPSAGDVEVLGTTARHAVQTGRVSAVMQNGGLLKDLTVAETVKSVHWTWVVNLLAWLAIFVTGAVWRFRADTARV